jgi:predicted heme/steroid binding protein/uncharacterized membrane protein
MSRSFTGKELARYNGEDGNPAYVAVDGKVYDVSKSDMWQDGIHMGRHTAGNDLTADLDAAPHGEEVFAGSNMAEVGTLTAEVEEPLPSFVRWTLERFPMARRHLHPISIHFPTAYFIAAALFTLVHLIYPNWLGIDFEVMGVALLVLGILFTPAAVFTGLFTWWINYALGRPPLIVRKLVFSAVLVLVEIACIVMKFGGFVQQPGVQWVYTGLIFWLAINVMILGYYGGQLVFPTKKSSGT